MLKPLLGSGAAIIFALALLFAGIASSITAGMAGGTIYAGMFAEPYDIDLSSHKDWRSSHHDWWNSYHLLYL